MNLLLDTQAFLYMTQEPERLPARARTAIEDAQNLRLLSVASPWELQIKMMLGKPTRAVGSRNRTV
jgi:PIN domain nuclease of toxin-antitoxin system